MPPAPESTFGPFCLLTASRQLLRDGQPVRLGARAFDLLQVLVEAGGEPVSKEALLARVWGTTVVDEGSIRVHVAALRKALGDDAQRPRYIASVPQRGYAFAAPVAVVGATDAPPPRPEPAPAGGAPVRLGGRDDAITAITGLFERERLVTLVGTGGIGKTRVAREVAHRLAPHRHHGTCFVDLSAVTDPGALAATVAAALGLCTAHDDPLGRVLLHLQGRDVLLVLDNCEQVVDAAAALAEVLLRRAAGVAVLCTSREALRAQGEWIHRLAGLAMPDDPAAHPRWTARAALAFPAVQLLVDRVQATLADFVLHDSDAPAALRICRTLDGIPLAIELAAAHVPSFGMGDLATLLAGRLTLLAHGRRTVLARHQTLRAALDWSHDLLDPAEQAVLRRLAVFRGPFPIEAAAQVCACPRIDPATAADRLVTLVNKSMVTLDAGPGHGPPRYRLLETTRRYALEKLADSGERAWLAARHARRVHDALTAAPHLPDAPSSLVPLDDVRAALDWSLTPGADPALGEALAVASAPLWAAQGLAGEHQDRLAALRAARGTAANATGG